MFPSDCGLLCAVSEMYRNRDIITNGGDGTVNSIHSAYQLAAQSFERFHKLRLPFL
jgi:hypothetical protein